MVKKLSEMALPYFQRGSGDSGRGGAAGGDDEEEEDRPKKNYRNGTTGHYQCAEENPPSIEEEIQEDAVEGQHLYMDFLYSQVVHEGLAMPPEIPRMLDPAPATRAQLMDWSRAGRELRMMADAFARSPERESVRLRAQKVTGNMEALDSENFLRLLQELFQEGGVTRERILVLFFFCADVALEALRKGYREMFATLIGWSIKYISSSVAEWVHNHGGWSVVLQSSLGVAYQVSATCAFVAVVVACVVYIRRNT